MYSTIFLYSLPCMGKGHNSPIRCRIRRKKLPPIGAISLIDVFQRITHVFVTNITLIDPTESRQQEEYSRLQARLQRSTGSSDTSHPRQRLLTALHAFHRYKERNLAETKRWRDWYKKIPKKQRSVCAPVKLIVSDTND